MRDAVFNPSPRRSKPTRASPVIKRELIRKVRKIAELRAASYSRQGTNGHAPETTANRVPARQALVQVPLIDTTVRTVRTRARPPGKTQRRIYETILGDPTTTYRGLCVAIFGEYTDLAYNNVRNCVRTMKKQHWMRGEPGSWTLGDGGKTGA